MNGSEGGNSGVCVGLVLLANDTTLNIFLHKGCKTGPPELGGNQLTGFQVARVTGCFMVVATGENGLPKGGIRGNVDMAFVGEDPFSILPVR